MRFDVISAQPMQKQNGGPAARGGKVFWAMQKSAHGLAARRNFAKQFIVHGLGLIAVFRGHEWPRKQTLSILFQLQRDKLRVMKSKKETPKEAPETDWPEPKRDRDLIARAIVVREGAILVNRSRNAKTDEEYFALPGGHIDKGEDCVCALEREFAEELDAKIAVYDLVFVSESIYAGRRKSETRRHELVLYFHADLASDLKENGKEVLSPEKDKNFQWLQLEAVPTSNILPGSVKEYLLATMLDRETAHYTFSDSTSPDAK